MTDQWKWASVKRIKEAAEELKTIIRDRYPDAQFRLARAHDDRDAWVLWTYVHIDDPDDVNDLVRDRERHMLVEEHIPIYVVPTLDPAGFAEPPRARARKAG
jgi:hypothetical protein